MANRKTDASIAFSVTDNLSQSVTRMRNSLDGFEQDVEGLQKQLDILQRTKVQLKNIDLKQAKSQVDEMRRALEELGDTATETERQTAQANFDAAVQNYNNVANQLDLVSRRARQTQKDLLNTTDAISKADNRASSVSSGGSMLAALGRAGLLSMAGDVALDAGNLLIGSAFGSETGGALSSGISGALSGAAMGSLGGPIAAAIGAAVGGGLGLIQGGVQAASSRDEAFKSYYSGLYEQGQTESEETLTSGSATAAQRELDAIAFERLLGEGIGEQSLQDLRVLAAKTPMEYDDLTTMSRALSTGFGDRPERMLELMTAIGDAGSAVGVTASDMSLMAQAMSRMNSSGKATLEYLNILQERGVNVIGMLADAYGKTQGEIYDMISKGSINGQDAVDIIQRGMETQYGGAMETMAGTFEGLTSTLSDAMTEIEAARGEGYNAMASQGLQADVDAYGGALGEALAQANSIIGEGQAIAENLARQYDREALEAVTLGKDTTVYSEEQADRLREMHSQYTDLVDQYQTATEEDKAVIAAQIDALMQEAEAMAESASDASDMSEQLHDVNLDLIAAIRQNTAAIESAPWLHSYEESQEQSKGRGSVLEEAPEAVQTSEYTTSRSSLLEDLSHVAPHAAGLRRVPYDGYAALLHRDERVLTASQAREEDRGNSGSGIVIYVTGNTFGAGMDEEAVAEAIANAAMRKLLAGFRA